MIIEYLISAFILGVIVAIPPGSVTVIACQRALQYGFKNSLLFTSGSCVSDIFYISLVYFGLTNFILNNNYKLILWIICGLLLVLIGILTVTSIKNESGDNKNSKTIIQAKPLITFISGIIVTLTNPLTIIGWIAIAGNFFIIWNNKVPHSNNYTIMTIMTIMLGVLFWFLPLTFLVSKLNKIINYKFQKYLIAFSGICLIIFGVISLFSAFKMV